MHLGRLATAVGDDVATRGHQGERGAHCADRHDICHKHHKQRLCKIFRSRVKFHIVDVLLEKFMYVLFKFLVIFSHVN